MHSGCVVLQRFDVLLVIIRWGGHLRGDMRMFEQGEASCRLYDRARQELRQVEGQGRAGPAEFGSRLCAVMSRE